MLVSARGGNIPTQLWISLIRQFAVTAIYAEFHDPGLPLPPHALLIVNAVGDADLCNAALESAPRKSPPAAPRR